MKEDLIDMQYTALAGYNMQKNEAKGSVIESVILHHSPEGILLESDNLSVLIGLKDVPLLKRGITRPLRDQAHESLGRGNYAFTRMGNLFVHLKDSPEMVFPPRVWLDRSGIRRVILSPTSQAVTA